MTSQQISQTVRVVCCAVALILLGSRHVTAQAYPTRPIVWVLPFGAGGIVDVRARLIARALSQELGQPVVIENKPGSAGITGTEAVAFAKPDGYTVLYGTSGPLATFEWLYKKLSYSPLGSFAPVHGISDTPLLFTANASRPFKDFKQFIEHARRNHNTVNYGSNGTGNGTHLAGELLQRAAAFTMTHVPYKEPAVEMADLLSGRIDAIFDAPATTKAQIEARQLRPLAVTGRERLKSLPDIPTMAESGFPEVVLTSWAAAMVPAGTSPEIVSRLAAAFNKALQDPAVIKFFEDNDSVALIDMGPERLRAFIESERLKFKELVQKSGATVE